MRKVVLSVAVSLDGFIEGPNGEYDWCFSDQDYGLSDFFKRVDTIFMGRKSYEMSLGMEDVSPSFFPKMKEFVFSNTLDKVKDGATLVKGNIRDQVEKIKRSPGKDIWLFGGAGLTTSLMQEGLVDELMIAIHPILLGAGKPLFQNINNRIHLELFDTKPYSTGLIMLRYNIK